MITVEQAIQNGIAILDAAGPKNWRELIDLNDLDMASIRWCILGQMYGEYSTGMMELFTTDDIQWESYGTKYGFEAPFSREFGRDYEALTIAWVYALNEV